MINRVLMPLAVGAVQLGAAFLVLGRPDPGPVLAFLLGGPPTTAEALAAARLLVWAVVLSCTTYAVGATLRQARALALRPLTLEGSALAVGLLILAVGVAHHLSSHIPMSGGSIQEARNAIGP
ncbi:MAG TPA: hypothetical protein VFD01_02850 [Candidatus Dormibacteraeota bacterium]|nr:hypothetical protein [Candidatus Dormibacteraeota bacterium]